MASDLIRKQFGATAADYATSAIHARGASLDRLVTLAAPRSSWRVLDVATGAGHTALAFAPHVVQVTAVDLTPAMLTQTARLAEERELANVTLTQGDAACLPFAAGSFDLVTCRLAAHHFSDVGAFAAAAARVLRPGGLLAVVDNHVPGSRLRGKKAKLQREAGRYINGVEKLRDPSHGRCLSLDEWTAVFREAGFVIEQQETLSKPMDFDDWAARMQVTAKNRQRLRAMLLQAPAPVADFLTPQLSGDRIKFRLNEAIILGRLGSEG